MLIRRDDLLPSSNCVSAASWEGEAKASQKFGREWSRGEDYWKRLRRKETQWRFCCAAWLNGCLVVDQRRAGVTPPIYGKYCICNDAFLLGVPVPVRLNT